MFKGIMTALVVVAALSGCEKSSEEGGRAGDDTFKIVVPAMTTTVKQGEIQTARVSVERGAGFKQPVEVQFKGVTGIDVDPGHTTVQPSDKGDVQVKITAAKDAPLGEQKILVKGTPEKGEPTETQFKVTVSAK